MIKVTAMVRDGTNPDNAIFTISYDVNGVIQPQVFMDYPMEEVVTDSLNEIKDKVLAFVAVERGDELWGQVQTKIGPFIGTDLEA